MAQPSRVVLTDEDMLLCVLKLNGATISNVIVTFTSQVGNRVALFLPLGEFSRVLELGIAVDPAARSASGFVATPSHSFMLDMAKSVVMVSGKPYRYDQSLVVALPDDIYVESALLAEWLAMRIDANRLTVRVNVLPFEPLPLQQKMEREKRGRNTWGYGKYRDNGYPRLDTPFMFLGGPSVDLSFSSSVIGNRERTIALGNSQYFSRISGDILWMNGQLDLSGDIAGTGQSMFGVDNGNLFLGRANPAGGLLGPMNAKRLAIGDIQPDPLPLIGGGSGAGVMISSYSSFRSAFFDDLTLRGVLANGWDVELFRNGDRLDYRPSNPENAYAFTDIPMLYGLNELKLVFHGPQGETRVETHYSNVGTNMTEPGSWNYQLTAMDASRNSLFSATRGNISPLLTWKSTIGLNQWITVNNYLASLLEGDKRQTFFGAGFSGYLKTVQVDMQFAGNLDANQWARQVGFQSKLDAAMLSFRWQDYDPGWQTIPVSVSSLKQWQARVDGIHPILFPHFSTLSAGLDHTEDEKHQMRNRTTVMSNNYTLGISHTHSIIFEQNQLDGGIGDAINGSSYASLMSGKSTFRIELGYQFVPLRVIKNVATTYEKSFPHEWRLSNRIGFSPSANSLMTSIGLSRSIKDYTMGALFNYASQGIWSVGLRLSTNLSREPQSGQWRADGTLNAAQAAVSAQAFLDLNRNRIWDQNELLIQDVGFSVNQRNSERRTSSNGSAFLQGLTPNILTDISILRSTLGNLSWVADKGVCVVPRSGCPVTVRLPVWVTGEVSGTMYRKVGNIQRLASGIVIEALDNGGTVASRAISGYDGMYFLKALPSGESTVRVSPEQAVKLRFSAPSQKVSIPADGGFVDGIDMVLDAIPVDSSGDVIGEQKSVPAQDIFAINSVLREPGHEDGKVKNQQVSSGVRIEAGTSHKITKLKSRALRGPRVKDKLLIGRKPANHPLVKDQAWKSLSFLLRVWWDLMVW